MDYVPIRLTTVRPKVNLDFNIYVKLPSKYLLYIKNGDDIEQQRIDALKSKKVRQLFISADDEKNYQNFIDNAILAAATDENMSASERAGHAQGVAAGAVEDFAENVDDKLSFDALEKAASGIHKIVGKRSEVLKEFYHKVAESDADTIFKHAITVSSLACSFGDMLKLSEKEVQNMGVASMVLDIGMTRMEKTAIPLFVKEYKDFTKEEMEYYRRHPQISIDALAGKDYINQEILDIVVSHEERRSGDGFPAGLKSFNSVTQEVVAMCACYDRMVTCLGRPHSEAFEHMQINELGNFDLNLITQFKKLLKSRGLA